MITISLCMILKDEEDIIKRCLDSVKEAVDEIIIVDTGSIDKTKEIVKNYTDKIYDFEWIEDFSAARNFSFSKATKDYILWLDGDEFITEENKNELILLKERLDTNIDVISFETHMCLDENNNPRVVARRNRLVKAVKDFKWIGYIHEYIEISGKIYDSDIAIIHDKVKCSNNRNLKIYRKNLEYGKKLSNRDLYYYGKELYFNKCWDEAIEILMQFVNEDGYTDEIIDALCKIGECYMYKCQISKAREYFYKTFEYDILRGDILYNIAQSFEKENKYVQAINWYKIILSLELPTDCHQCVNLDCWRFKPHMNLCICYFEINDLRRSYYHHRKCVEINSNNPCVIENEKFFKSIMIDKSIEN